VLAANLFEHFATVSLFLARGVLKVFGSLPTLLSTLLVKSLNCLEVPDVNHRERRFNFIRADLAAKSHELDVISGDHGRRGRVAEIAIDHLAEVEVRVGV
jgi:hypothetical protein